MMDYVVTVLKTKKRLSVFQKKSLVSRREGRKSLILLKMENVHDSLFFHIIFQTKKDISVIVALRAAPISQLMN